MVDYKTPMINDQKLVEKSYDQIAEEYLRRFRLDSDANKHTLKYLKLLIKLLPQNSKILDLGCGAGIPATKILAPFHEVIGVDISEKQIQLARKNTPEAKFIKADMLEIDFPVNSFDAIVSLYAIIHVPRKYHRELLEKIWKMLKPGGYFLATMGATDLKEAKEENWLGVPMYWSHFNRKKNTTMLEEVGFEILKAKVEIEKELNEKARHLYVLARKSST
ncbi:class I SAM-dependent methyltransferase [bacterium]|nr:class I SAM-dependent methyltransferase [bacterium]